MGKHSNLQAEHLIIEIYFVLVKGPAHQKLIDEILKKV